MTSLFQRYCYLGIIFFPWHCGGTFITPIKALPEKSFALKEIDNLEMILYKAKQLERAETTSMENDNTTYFV